MNSQQNTLKILLVEDHPIYREGLQLALSYSGLDCKVVGAVATVKQAVEYIESHPSGIDLVMLDFYLPDGNGGDVVRKLKETIPQAKVLVVTSATDAPEVGKLVVEGISGIISKDVQSSEVASIVKQVMQGKQCFDNSLPIVQNDHVDSIELTHRETEIVRLCAQGKSARQIAGELFISPRTAERHKENIYNKLGFKTSAELVKYAIRKGLI